MLNGILIKLLLIRLEITRILTRRSKMSFSFQKKVFYLFSIIIIMLRLLLLDDFMDKNRWATCLGSKK